MSAPRFDDRVKYLIPAGLYKDIMSLLGLPRPVLCSQCEADGYWVGGDFCKSMLDLLHCPKSEKCDALSSELYVWLAEGEPEPEAPELQEVE